MIAATFLSGLATSAWAWTAAPFYRDATLVAVTIAAAAARASSAMLARPSLGNLLRVALGNGNGGGGGGTGSSVNDGYHRRRSADGTLLAVAVGTSQSIGVLGMGAVFSKAVRAGADAGVVSFRLMAAAFVGVYLATLFVHSSEGTAGAAAMGGGGGARARLRGGLPWVGVCDVVEQAVAAATTVSSTLSSSYTLGEAAAAGGDEGRWGLLQNNTRAPEIDAVDGVVQ